MKTRYNSAKKRAREIFAERSTWMRVPTWAMLSGVTPVRRAYTYLARLAHFGLLEKARDPNGRLLYRITNRGCRRLRWLPGNAPVAK